MYKVRAVFTKTDRSIYISHLDLMRCMQRAMKRARIPVWYTEGFNPHAYIMFPLALALGVRSGCEIMDFTITEEMPGDEIIKRLNSALPSGIQLLSVSEPQKKHTEIAMAEYKVFFGGLADTKKVMELWTSFLGQNSIMIEKKNKKKQLVSQDIRPMIKETGVKASLDSFFVTMLLPAGTQTNLNSTVVTDAFLKYCNESIPVVRIERTKILCENGESFA